MTLHVGDVLDPFCILKILSTVSPPVDEIYHLAAQSHVAVSFHLQLYTCDVNALGTVRILQAIITLGLQARVKFYNVCNP